MSGVVLTGSQRAQLKLVKIVLWALGRGFAGCAKHDKNVQRELESWAEGATVKLSVPGGADLLLKKHRNRILVLKKNTVSKTGACLDAELKADITIYFKSIESATSVMTGQTGIWQAYARHFFALQGDIFFAMSIIRCMDVIENYLFPGIMSGKIMRRRPEKTVSSLRMYWSVLFGA